MEMKRINRILLIGLICMIASPLYAQYEKLGGVYYAYPATATELKEAPRGYEPFYISHYGRHGSRWLPNDKRYKWVCKHFDDTKNLTRTFLNSLHLAHISPPTAAQ